MTVIEQTNDNPVTPECAVSEYVPCTYEKIFGIFTKFLAGSDREKTWLIRIGLSVMLYLAGLAVFFTGIYLFDEYTIDTQPYIQAVFVLATLVFWPIIIIYDAELFYSTCKKLRGLLTPEAQSLDWYARSAEKYFCFFPRSERIPFGAILINGGCTLAVAATYFLKIYRPDIMPTLFGQPWLLITSLALCALTVFLEKRYTNLLASMLTVCAGLAYYAYLTAYAPDPLVPLLATEFVAGTVVLVGLVCFVFFLAGTTLMPMLGLFKTFFLSDFQDKIEYPMDEIACSVDTLQAIKKYFLHLTGINLLAFFQLLATVYFLGLLDTDFVLTKVLFVLGSFFPGVMYLAANLFFKKMYRKIYSLQVRNIDARIYQGLKAEVMNADEIEALVAVKEMYANEFEIHAAMNKEVLIAMLSPVGSAVVAVIFPASSFLGG